jgi:NADH dehydrogenase
MNAKHRVVIVGGGFGGLFTALNLSRADAQVTLIDRRNFHLFQPLLYQVATGSLSPANIAAPLRAILKRQRNTRVILGQVVDVDVAGKKVVLSDGQEHYDTLVVATGASHHYFGKPWEPLAPSLKTVEDATEIRRRVLLAFEGAEREPDPEKRQRWLTFVIVGGGPTGVELAGAVADMAHYTLRRNFRNSDPSKARILLVEGADRVLPPYVPQLSAKAAKSLTHLGVTVWANSIVTDIQPDSVTVRRGDQTEMVPTHTVVWAAGVEASPLGKILGQATGTGLDKAGRVLVQPDLTLNGHPETFVIGDMANCSHQTGKPLPGVAPVAMQQAKYVANLIKRRLQGINTPEPPFRYRDLGSMATIGRAAAVVDLGWVRYSGYLAWLTWLFIHLLNIVEFENRWLVLAQWSYSYFTRNRSARLITGDSPFPLLRP